MAGGAAYAVFTKIIGQDAASEVVGKVGDAYKRLLSPINRVNEAFSKPSTTALGRVGAKVDEVAGKFRSRLKDLSSWLPALGAITTALSLHGLIEMTRNASEAYDGIGKAAEKLGFTVPQLAQFRYAVKDADVDIGSFEKGIGQLNKRMVDAASGKNKDLAGLFRAMGISLRDSKGHVKDASQVLVDISESFHRTGNAAVRDAMAMALFGKAGMDLVPFLIRGREETTKLMAEQKKYYGLTKDQALSLNELDDSYKRLDAAGGGLRSRLGASLAPLMGRIVTLTSDWIARNRELIGQSIDRKVSALGHGYDLLAKAMGVVLAVPFVAELLKGTDASTGFDVALGALGLTMAGPVFSAVSVVLGAWKAMTVAMLTNPVGLLLTGIAAAAYAIYANWGSITSWFDEQMTAIRAAFDRGLISGLIETWNRLNPVTLIMTTINGLSKWLFDIDLAAAGKRIIQSLIDGIKSLLPDFNAVWGPVERGMNWVSDRASAAAGQGAAVAGAVAGGADMSALSPLPSIGGAGAPLTISTVRDARVTVDVNVKAPTGTSTSVNSQNVDRTNVGRSMPDSPGSQ